MSDLRLRVSARNRLTGTVAATKSCAAVTEVIVDLDGGHRMVSMISTHSAEAMELRPGKRVELVVKSTEVMLGTTD